MNAALLALAAVGALCLLYVSIGLSRDIVDLDQTSGGYASPYSGWTGTPVDWDAMDQTPDGLVKRGYVVDVHIHGTTGMMSFEVLGLRIEWQQPSPRALVVHQPRQGLKRRGFSPRF